MNLYTRTVVVALCIVPFLNPEHSAPLATFHTEAIAFGLGLALILRFYAYRDTLEAPLIVVGLFSASGLVLVQEVLGFISTPRALAGAAVFAWAAYLVHAGAEEQHRDAGTVDTLQAALAAGGFLAAVAGIIQHYGLSTIFGGFNILYPSPENGMVGTLAQRNLFANYVSLGIISTGVLFVRSRLTLTTAILMLAPMAGAVALSGSRSSIVFLGIFAAAICWLRAERGYLIGAITFSILAVVTLSPLVGTVQTGIERIIGDSPGSWHRAYLFEHAWALFIQVPFIGAGFGEFEKYLPSIGPMDTNAHNLALHLGAELGALGALLIIGPLVYHAAKFKWKGAHSPSVAWAVACLAVQFAHSAVEFPLWNVNFLGVTCLIMGSLLVPNCPRSSARLSTPSKPS